MVRKSLSSRENSLFHIVNHITLASNVNNKMVLQTLILKFVDANVRSK